MKKLLETAWVSPLFGWDRVPGNHLGGESDSQLMEIQIWCSPASSVGEGFRKETVASARTSIWEKAFPPALNARHFSTSPFVPGSLQADAPVLEHRGSESE